MHKAGDWSSHPTVVSGYNIDIFRSNYVELDIRSIDTGLSV